jgi:hypothetical protein
MKEFMFHNNKANFEASVSKQILVSADWRDRQLQDSLMTIGITKAKARLLELESEIDISDAKWEQLEPIVQGNKFLTAISETNRDVGFRTHPIDFSAWLENLHSNLVRH